MGKLLKFLAGERTKRAELAGAVMLVAGRPQNRGGETGRTRRRGDRQNATERAQVEDDEAESAQQQQEVREKEGRVLIYKFLNASQEQGD